jgi:hypothetical protein
MILINKKAPRSENMSLLRGEYFHVRKKPKSMSTSYIKRENPTIPIWFDWNYYLNRYQDVKDAGIETEQNAYDHWIHNGEREGRECMKNYLLFKQYPNLFHKYLLGLSKSEDPMNYLIVSETNITKKHICSIHCYDLKNFGSFFDEYILVLSVFFDFVVTYVNDITNIRFQYNFTFIKMENKGMDIGSKFITVDYLKNKNIPYSYVFFIHSKSSQSHRNKYIKPFIENLHYIIDKIEFNKFDAIFNGEIGKEDDWVGNNIYMIEMISYLHLDPNFWFFPAGNFYIISKDICESLFTDVKIYNTLNTFNSFDYSWVKNYYKLRGDYTAIYDNYKTNNLYGNNLETTLGHRGLADSMIEHVFERLMFLICKRDNKIFYICDKIKENSDIENTELTISVMACHSENAEKINTIVNNVRYLNEISDIIYIVDTDSLKGNHLIQSLQNSYPSACINYKISDEKTLEYLRENPDLSHMTIEDAKTHFALYGYKETNRLRIFSSFIFVLYCENSGYCYGKWRYFYENVANETKYKNYILTNDSFLITKPLDQFDSLIKMEKYDLVSLTASDILRSYTTASIDIYIKYIKTQLLFYKDFLNLTKNIEAPSFKLCNNYKCISLE